MIGEHEETGNVRLSGGWWEVPREFQYSLTACHNVPTFKVINIFLIISARMHHPVDIQWWLKILIFRNLYQRSGEQTNNSCQVLYREWWEILDLEKSKLTTMRSESSTSSKWLLEVLRMWVHFHDVIRGSGSHVRASFSLLILFWCSLPSRSQGWESGYWWSRDIGYNVSVLELTGWRVGAMQ